MCSLGQPLERVEIWGQGRSWKQLAQAQKRSERTHPYYYKPLLQVFLGEKGVEVEEGVCFPFLLYTLKEKDFYRDPFLISPFLNFLHFLWRIYVIFRIMKVLQRR